MEALYASHGTECHTGAGVIRRHDNVRDSLASLYRQAGYTASVEDRELLGDERRPADVYVLNYDLDKHCCIDVAVVSGMDPDGR